MSEDLSASNSSTPSGVQNNSAATLEELSAGHRHLRRLFHCMAISLILLTGTLFVFLYRQVILVRRQTLQLSRYATQYEALSNHKVIDDLRNKLGAFARQNPDFQPIFTKYFPPNGPGQTQPGPPPQLSIPGPGAPAKR